MKKGEEKKKSGSSTPDEEHYAEKEDLITLFDRMLTLASENTEESREEAEELAARIIVFQEDAAELAMDLVRDESNPSFILGCFILSGVGGDESVRKLVALLDNENHSTEIGQLIVDNIGKASIPYLLARIKGFSDMTFEERKPFQHTIESVLLCIGSVRSSESVAYLTELLDDYISNLPEGPFDPYKHKWKYSFFDLFHILEALVRQQSRKAIKSIQRARDRFPIEYVDHRICQVALGRIMLRKPEGFIPLEAMEMAFPMDQLFRAMEGVKSRRKDKFMENYGEYFTADLYPFHSKLKFIHSSHKEYDEDMGDNEL